jgi:hypothetical protein
VNTRAGEVISEDDIDEHHIFDLARFYIQIPTATIYLVMQEYKE